MIPVVGSASTGRDDVVVAVCQLAPRIGEVDHNLARVREAVTTAARAGANLVVLPELCSSGYVFLDRAEAYALAEPVGGRTVSTLVGLAEEHGLVLVGGFPERAGADVLNSAALVDPTGVRAVYRKAHLWGREAEVFTPGDEPAPVVDTAVGRVGVVICYDLEFPEWVRSVALRGADIICAPTNWPAEPRPAHERPVEVVKVQANAAVNRVFVAAADRTGVERGVGWVAGSVIVGPDGYPVVLRDPDVHEQVLVGSCRVGQARDKRLGPFNHVFEDRRTELYAP